MKPIFLILSLMIFPFFISATERLLVGEAGEYQRLSNSEPGGSAAFRLVTLEQRGWAYGLGDWARRGERTSAAFVFADKIWATPPLALGTGSLGRLQGNLGLGVLDDPTERLGTRWQIHAAIFLTITLEREGSQIRVGCHHFSNGSRIHGVARSKPNSAEEFCSIGIGVTF